MTGPHLIFLFRFFRLPLAQTRAKSLNAFAQFTAKFANAANAKNNQDDGQHDQQLRCT